MSKMKTELQNDPLMPLRHSTEHIMQLVVEKMLGIKKVMGPAIDNGFYGDFNGKITEEDLEKIESEMKKIIEKDLPIEIKKISLKVAKELFKNNKFKLEILEDIKNRNETVMICELGKEGDSYHDIDICAGPHVKSTGEINADAIKLLSIAGAYWKGDEKKEMLTRIYGTAFNTKKELEEYLNKVEEAKKRDHRKLGKELDLFTFSELVGAGLPLFTPKGTVIKEELQKHIEKIGKSYGYKKVMTPHLAKIDLYEISGHAIKFKDELFHVTSEKGHEFVMKPVQCPHQTQIYASRPRSYRDLPIRYMESEKQYRAEKSGEVGGLNRVYAITVEDGHTFCTLEQVNTEIKNLIKTVKEFYEPLGLWDNHWVSLSVRDYSDLEKYIGDEKDWDECERILEEIAKEMNLEAIKVEGEAALYGPKLDFMFKDAMGKDIQIPTIQLDFATPKRFKLEYTNEKGESKTPVMIHRAILGSYERIMALLIEHFAGAFPTWLAPVQVQVIPIGEKHIEYANKIVNLMREKDIRVELDDRSETMQLKIRYAQTQKIPYMIIVGDKEVENDTVSVRLRTEENKGTINLNEFIDKIKEIELTKGVNLW